MRILHLPPKCTSCHSHRSWFQWLMHSGFWIHQTWLSFGGCVQFALCCNCKGVSRCTFFRDFSVSLKVAVALQPPGLPQRHCSLLNICTFAHLLPLISARARGNRRIWG